MERSALTLLVNHNLVEEQPRPIGTIVISLRADEWRLCAFTFFEEDDSIAARMLERVATEVQTAISCDTQEWLTQTHSNGGNRVVWFRCPAGDTGNRDLHVLLKRIQILAQIDRVGPPNIERVCDAKEHLSPKVA